MIKKYSLTQAAIQGDALAVQLALQAGEDPKANDSYALSLAAANERLECLVLLLPMSGAETILKAAQEAQQENRAVAGIIRSFIEARALSASCPKKSGASKSWLL